MRNGALMRKEMIFPVVGLIFIFNSLNFPPSFGQAEKSNNIQNASSSSRIIPSANENSCGFYPHEEWWCDCDVEPAKMSFRKNGILLLNKSFKWLSPCKWEYSINTKELKIVFPKKVSKRVHTFFEIQKRNLEFEKKTPTMKYNAETRELTFPFDEKTLSIELFGWFFYKQ